MKKMLEIGKEDQEKIQKEFPKEELVKITTKIISSDDELSCVVITQIFLEQIINKLFELKCKGDFYKIPNLNWQYKTQLLVLNQIGILDDKNALLLHNFPSLRNKFAHSYYTIKIDDMNLIATNEELKKVEMLDLACLSLIFVTLNIESEIIDYFSPTMGESRRKQQHE